MFHKIVGLPNNGNDCYLNTSIQVLCNDRAFQQMIEGTVNNSLNITAGTGQNSRYFQLPPKPIDPSRVIFYGPNHPQYPLKLNLTYTKL